MTKKILALAIVLAMIFVLAIPAFAADTPDIKAVMSGNGAKATLTVIVDGVQSEPLIWSNNNTTVVELNGYVVSVAIKGNKADKVTWEKVTIATAPVGTDTKEPAVESGDDTGAAVIFTDPDIGGGGKTNGVDEETELPKVIVPANSASFHCNTYGGNGRVWVDAWTADLNAAVKEAAAMGLKKASVGLEFTQASEDAKRWILITTDYVCPKCERTDWISFSNKSGAPNGKNMQLQHLAIKQPEEPEYKYSYALNKTVDGAGIVEWASADGIDMLDLYEQMTFYAFAVSGNGADIPEGAVPAATGELDPFYGEITFSVSEYGWYAITEEFAEGSWAEENFKSPKLQYYKFGENGSITKGSTIDWDDEEVVAEFTAMNAVAASDYAPNEALVAEALVKGSNKKVDLRANVANAFGAADAIQGMTNGDEKFAGLRFFNGGTTEDGEVINGVTYYFGSDADNTYDIYNNPDSTKADLSLIEVTWTTAWHTEAVDVFMVNAVMADGTVVDELRIGRAFNRKNLVGDKLPGFRYEVKLVGNFTYTDIFLPDDIVKASAIRLVDATTDINTPIATHKEYKAWDDGYDLDALLAYYTLPSNTFENKLGSDEEVEPKGTIAATIAITAKQNVITYGYEENTTTQYGSVTAGGYDNQVINPNSGKPQWFRYTEVNVADAREIPVLVDELRHGNDANDTIDAGFEISIDEYGFVWIDLLDLQAGKLKVALLDEGATWDNNGGHDCETSGRFNTGLNVEDAEYVKVYAHFDDVTYLDGSYTRVIATTELDVPTEYTGTISLVVTNEAGEEVFTATGTLAELITDEILDPYFGLIAIGEFESGTYTATLSGERFEAQVREGTIVNDGDEISFEFAPIVVTYDAREIDPGCPCELTHA